MEMSPNWRQNQNLLNSQQTNRTRALPPATVSLLVETLLRPEVERAAPIVIAGRVVERETGMKATETISFPAPPQKFNFFLEMKHKNVTENYKRFFVDKTLNKINHCILRCSTGPPAARQTSRTRLFLVLMMARILLSRIASQHSRSRLLVH